MTTHHRKAIKPSYASFTKPCPSLSKPSRFLLVSMASFVFLSLLTLTLFLTLSSAARHRHHPMPTATNAALTQIQLACKATRFPDTCQSSLSQLPYLPPNPTPVETIGLAIGVSSDGLKSAQKMVTEDLAGLPRASAVLPKQNLLGSGNRDLRHASVQRRS